MLQSNKHKQQWSKLKKQLKDLWCDSLKDRLDIHATSYRKSHDSLGKIWITLDGQVVFEANSIENEMGLEKDSAEYSQWTCLEELVSYIHRPFEESLSSNDKVTKILCLLDRRLGKRRLAKLLAEAGHGVEKLYKIRLEAENIRMSI